MHESNEKTAHPQYTKGVGEWASRRVADADRPAPSIRRGYPHGERQRVAWEALWHALSGGLWFTVEELAHFTDAIRPESIGRMMRYAVRYEHVTRRDRVQYGRTRPEYSRNPPTD